ncbi:tetratricopeptide repeat protein [Sphingobacterium sp. N143]|nr:tetratricopeptide repeat protein [Sphingobacterium sp. N143]
MNLKSFKLGLFTGVFALMALNASAQQPKQAEQHSNANVRMGQKALLDGDFKNAESYLTKALPQEGKDPDVLYMLGYSQFQNGDYKKSAETFGKVVALNGKNANALYFKGKATNNLAVQANKISVANKEQLLRVAIEDYSKAIAITPNDAKFYQNRAIANRDLGILIGTAGTPNYNKAMATDAYNNAIKDYEKVLSFDASKKDIQTEIKKAKVYRDNLK